MTEISFLVSGIIFGLSGGLTPGPLLTLVIAESIRHGKGAGIKISISPLITDSPIVLLAVFIISNISNISFLIGIIYLLGCCFLVYLGFESILFKGSNGKSKFKIPNSWLKGIVANFLNPSPYIFWLTIGAPIIVRARAENVLSVFLFIFSMYLFLVGSKIVLVLIISKSRIFLKSSIYINAIRFLGVVLILFALFFLKEAIGILL